MQESAEQTRLSSNDKPRIIDQKVEDVNSKHVIVLNIGGTIASHRTERGYAPSPPNRFLEDLLKLANFHDDSVNLAPIRSLPRYTKHGLNPIALPKREDDKLRIFYAMHELLPLLDSSDMNQTDWVRLAVAIQLFYRDFDGFVILHGTDTMCYTSSALSFMLENLGKTIIITGAQIPLVEPDSDAASNLYGSIFIAGNFIIPEVSLYCCNKLYRGNRSTKLSANEFEAFSSPNATPIAIKGTKLKSN
eukprot:TRINITY_DN1539_c0_g1_i6.p1 TRINITY_DN1539_c0_g1~~TRINITY_DN1539_c0_g1_i6.p1  ORF type:complete len:247 (-),score=37.97 TRINITY_DN1539_c0_g1_i6:965-1705(-)